MHFAYLRGHTPQTTTARGLLRLILLVRTVQQFDCGLHSVQPASELPVLRGKRVIGLAESGVFRLELRNELFGRFGLALQNQYQSQVRICESGLAADGFSGVFIGGICDRFPCALGTASGVSVYSFDWVWGFSGFVQVLVAAF